MDLNFQFNNRGAAILKLHTYTCKIVINIFPASFTLYSLSFKTKEEYEKNLHEAEINITETKPDKLSRFKSFFSKDGKDQEKTEKEDKTEKEEKTEKTKIWKRFSFSGADIRTKPEPDFRLVYLT